MSELKNIGPISLGLIYYPEHWREELWEDDLRRIHEMGFRILRLGEFSWSKIEPTEGEFTFDFWDRFLDLAHQYGFRVIFGTPTATPPAWVTHTYPETRNVRRDGVAYHHGARRHYNYNAPKYRELSRRIVTEIARHYGGHPAIIGWQIDNELNCEVDSFYSESDHAAFRVWLREKYGTLDKLNAAWGTAFWNQQYSDWDQVGLTRVVPSNGHNPHQLLDEKRFISRTTIEYAVMQAEILKAHVPPEHFITTNGLYPHLDYHELAERELDFIALDSFPCFAYNFEHQPETDPLKDRRWVWEMMESRSIKGTFAVFEQSSYAGGWIGRLQGPTPKPGQLRLWTFMGFAHGADYAGFYRWRSCSFGVEMYWHGMNHYSNKPNKGYYEIRDLLAEMPRLKPVTASEYQAEVAILRDYDNVYDGEYDVWHGPHDARSQEAWLLALQHSHTPADLVYLRENTTLEELRRYRLLVYPHATILPENRANLLRAYVEGGGTLVMGARTGYKDLEGHCPMRDLPGLARDICGAVVDDFSFIGACDAPQTLVWNGKELPAPYFNDVIEPWGENAQVVARFNANYYAGRPAIVRNPLGQGVAYYAGTVFSPELAREFLDRAGVSEPYRDLVALPEGCEIALRQKGADQYYFVLNYEGEPAQIEIKQPLAELLGCETLAGWHTVEPYGVRVLHRRAE